MGEYLINWIRKNKHYFFYATGVVIITLLIAVRFSPRKNTPSVIAIENAYKAWKSGGEIHDLQKYLQRYPNFETKFNALIVQHLLLKGEGQAAQPFVHSIFQRILPHIPQHTVYAEGSLLIAQGNLQDAFKQALSFKEGLSKNSLLYGFCLLRLASLCKELNILDQELTTLEELEQFIHAKSPNALLLGECFSEQEATLESYIAHRRKELFPS